MAISLRPATPEDEEFVCSVYAVTRAAELERVPWSDEQKEAFVRMQFAAQHGYYRERYPAASYDLIVVDGEPVGRLYVRREPETIHIMDVTVLPKHRKLGTGTTVIQRLMEEARRESKPIEIYVETFSPSVRLFEQLGFTRKAEEGINYLMHWRAPD